MGCSCYQSLSGQLLVKVWTDCAGYGLNSGLHVLLNSFSVTYLGGETLDSKLVLSYNIPHAPGS